MFNPNAVGRDIFIDYALVQSSTKIFLNSFLKNGK